MRRLVLGALVAALAIVPSVVQAAVGQTDPGFGTGGVVTGGLLDEFGPVTVDAQGRTVVLGVESGSIAIARYLANGAPDTTFSGDGRADIAIPVVTFVLLDVRVLDDGSIVAIGRRTTVANQPFSNGLWAAKVTATGAPAAGYGTNGVATLDQGFTAFGEAGSIAPDGSAVITQGGIGGGFGTSISPTGAFGDVILDIDPAAFGPGCVFQSGLRPIAAVKLSATDLIHAAEQFAVNCVGGTGPDLTKEGVVVTRQQLDGTVLWSRLLPSFETDEPQNTLEVVGSDVLLGTTNGTASAIVRLATADGTPVAGWGTAGRAALADGFGRVGGITELPGGRVGVVNAPTSTNSPTSVIVDRLLSDGKQDPSFPRYAAPVGGALTRTAIAGAPDGDIVVTTQHAGEGTVRHIVGGTATVPDAVPTDPARLLDTRPGETTVDGLFQGIGLPAAGSITKVKIAGRGGIPDDATAAIINLTMIRPDARGYATVYPCTPTPPTASNVNYEPGDIVANSVTAKLDADGNVCVFTFAASHILIDGNGYTPPGTGIGTVTPARLLETRPGETTVDGLSQGGGVAAAGSTTKVKIAGRGGIPDDATAAIINLTMIRPDARGYATVYPCTPTPPTASNVNYEPGDIVANSVTAKLDADGNVCVFTFAASHILIDALGFVEAGASAGTVTPARLLETRPGETTVDGLSQGGGVAAAGSTTKVKIAGRGGIPDDATAAIINLTMIRPDARGYATVYPCTPTPPTASNVNYEPGDIVANSVTAKLDADGNVCVFTFAASHILIDALGFLTE